MEAKDASSLDIPRFYVAELPFDDDRRTFLLEFMSWLPVALVDIICVYAFWSWDTEGTLQIKTLIGHWNTVCSLAILPNQKLASGSEDDCIKFWNVQKLQRKVTPFRTLKGHNHTVFALLYSPIHNGILISASGDRKVKIWNMSGTEISSFNYHTQEVRSLLLQTPTRLISAGLDAIRVWDLNDYSIKKATNKGGRCLASFSDGTLAAGTDRGITYWDMETQTVTREISTSLECLTSCPQGIAYGDKSGTVTVQDVNGKQVCSFKDPESKAVQSLALCPDGRLATGMSDGRINVWDFQTLNIITTLNGHTNGVKVLAFSERQHLFSGSLDDTIREWFFV